MTNIRARLKALAALTRGSQSANAPALAGCRVRPSGGGWRWLPTHVWRDRSKNFISCRRAVWGIVPVRDRGKETSAVNDSSMSRRAFLQLAAASAALPLVPCPACAGEAGLDLPHGNAPRPVDTPWFPSRLHAFVWRNWQLVAGARLAFVPGCATMTPVAGSAPRSDQRAAAARRADDHPTQLAFAAVRSNS